MERIYVDVSVFTPVASIGVVHGHMDVEFVPSEGEVVAFSSPLRPIERPDVAGFSYSVVVEDLMGFQGVSGGEVLVSLADITLPTRAEALKVAHYLSNGFNLHFDEHPS